MNVFYYYYYLFYTMVLPDRQPHLTVVFTLSSTMTFLVIGIADFILVHLFHYNISANIMKGIFVFLFIITYLLYIRNGRGRQIVIRKPMFFKNHNLSILLTLIFFFMSLAVFL
jgi:hypothetical protein